MPNRRIADARKRLRAVDLLEDVEIEQGSTIKRCLHVDGNLARQAVGFAGLRASVLPERSFGAGGESLMFL
jgi:hypothetical protein